MIPSSRDDGHTNEPVLRSSEMQSPEQNADCTQMEERRSNLRSTLIQVMVGLVANLATVSPGMSLGFSAVALPHMRSAFAVPQINSDEASWIASLAAIATPFGCLLSGPLLDKFGRKMAVLIINVPIVIGWVLLASAPHTPAMLPQVYSGRVMTGLATGMGSIPATVYVGETSQQSIRGMLVTWTSIGIALGILLVYILGWFLQHNWRLVAGLCLIFPLLSVTLSWALLPESPAWLIGKGRVQEAEVSLRFLRGVRKDEDTPLSVQDELDVMTVSVTRQSQLSRKNVGTSKFASLMRPETLKPLLIMNAFFFFQQFSGIFVVVFYAVDVVKEAGVEIDGYFAAVLIGLTRVLVTIAISYASKRFGRRPLAIISGVGMTVCMGSLAIFLCVVKNNGMSPETVSKLSWFPVTGLILYILLSTVGFLTLPFAMIGEVFPSRVRGIASGITTCLAYIFSFIIVKVYPSMLTALGRDGVFFFYGGMSLLGTVFVLLFLPETQGKSLQEIEEYFRGKGTSEEMNNGVTSLPLNGCVEHGELILHEKEEKKDLSQIIDTNESSVH